MVRGDVEQDGYVGTELIHVVELETTQLDDIVFVRCLSYLQSQALADVACQAHVIASRLDDVVDQGGGSGLSVASGDANHLGIRISASKLYLADDRSTLSHQLLYHGSFLRDARAFDDFIGIQYLFLRMMSLFPFDVMFIHQFLVVVFDLRHIRHKDFETFLLGKNGSSCAAFASS